MEWRSAQETSVGYQLYQQVKEQSNLCDVTVQVGKWVRRNVAVSDVFGPVASSLMKKRFHWCVLVASPFFECIRRGNFVEKYTGLVNLNVTFPIATEAAILFLYGKQPQLGSWKNIEAMLYMAEFLLIPKLKKVCVSLLQRVRITEENCMKVIELSSIYEFDVPKCYKYIKKHLPVILKSERAINLTRESVLKLFKDPLLSYALGKEKFEFSIKWAESSQQNKDAFNEVVDVIDMESIDAEFLETVVQHHLLITEETKRNIQNILQRGPLQRHKVIVFPYSLADKKDVHICLDLQRKLWYGIKIALPIGETSNRTPHTLETRGANEVLHVFHRYNDFKLCIQDLQSEHCSSINISISGHKMKRGRLDTNLISVVNDTLAIAESDFGYALPLRTTILCGKIQHPETNVYPVLTLRNEIIGQMSMNKYNCIALRAPHSAKLHIYDLLNCAFETIELEYDFKNVYSSLEASANGFVIYSQETVINISCSTDPSSEDKYAIQRIDLKQPENIHSVFYMYAKDIWVRLLTRKKKDVTEVACASHAMFIKPDASGILWEQLPSPTGESKVSFSTIYVLDLPSSKLRCHYDCPHCETPAEQTISNAKRSAMPRDFRVGISNFLDSDDDLGDMFDFDVSYDDVYEYDY